MKVCLSWVFIVIIFISSGFRNISAAENAVLSDYQKDVIGYFKEIALGYEFGTATPITRKWNRTMKVYLSGTANETHRNELVRVVDELNELITDDFEIEIVQDKASSNLHLFVGSGEEFASMYSADGALAKANSGIYRVFWNQKNEILKGYIFIKNSTSLREQRHAIREELTQCLGLGRDSDHYQESIFQINYTLPTEYAPIDRDLIRLLYHPGITVGLNAYEVEARLTEILLFEAEHNL